MNQYDFGTIDPFVNTGEQLADMLNNWRDAIHSWHRGPTRPGYAVPGMMWINDTGGPTSWLVMVYLGPTMGDVMLWVYDTTSGAVSMANLTQITSAILLAESAASPSVRWSATGNTADARAFRATITPSGALRIAAYNDAGAEMAGITIGRDGKLTANLSNATGLPEGGLNLTDVATGDVSTTRHGFAPKLPNDAAKFLNGVGAWATPGALIAAPTYDTLNARTLCTVGPGGDGVMQISQGTQIFSRVYTPLNEASLIEVDVRIVGGASGAAVWPTVGLFIDGAANAVAQTWSYLDTVQSGITIPLYWQGALAAGPHTFTVRVSGTPGQCYVLGNDSGRWGGGQMRSSMLIRESGTGAKGPTGDKGPPGDNNVVQQFKYKECVVRGTLAGTFNTANATMPLITEGAALDSITITPIRADSVLEIDAHFKGSSGGDLNFMLACFRGSMFVDNDYQQLRSAGSMSDYLLFRSIIPSPGAGAAQTFNFRVGTTGGGQWAQGMINTGSGMAANPNMRSWMSIREIMATP